MSATPEILESSDIPIETRKRLLDESTSTATQKRRNRQRQSASLIKTAAVIAEARAEDLAKQLHTLTKDNRRLAAELSTQQLNNEKLRRAQGIQTDQIASLQQKVHQLREERDQIKAQVESHNIANSAFQIQLPKISLTLPRKSHPPGF